MNTLLNNESSDESVNEDAVTPPSTAADGSQSAAPVDPENSAPLEDRPEWLPEKYKSGEELAKAYTELSSKLGKKEEDLRSDIEKEMQEKLLANRPEKAGDYQLPDYIDDAASVDSDLLKWWSEHSFEQGFSQEQFEKGIEMYRNALDDGYDQAAEIAKLGDNAKLRIDAASAFAKKTFPEEVMPAIERLTETGEGIKALEIIMEKMKEGGFSGDGDIPKGLTAEELKTMMADPRYYDPAKRDAAYVRKVDEGFQKLYG